MRYFDSMRLRHLLTGDWRPDIRKAVSLLIEINEIDDIIDELKRSGYSDEQATKLALFVPSAFAREMYEPDGVRFMDTFIRHNTSTGTRMRRQYADEPIYEQARRIAREMIDAERFQEIDNVIIWSAESQIMQQATDKGVPPGKRRLSENVHHF